VTLLAPDAAGAHEARYISGQTDATLAALPITLTENAASLEAPPVANAGAEVEVAWRGPDNRGDYITIVAAGAPEGTRGKRQFTKEGSPVTLLAPDAAGAHEARYISGQTDATLAALPITLTEKEAQAGGSAPDAETPVANVPDPAPANAAADPFSGIFGDAANPGRDFFLAPAKPPLGSDLDVPEDYLMLGAVWGDVAPWYLEPVSETRYAQAWVNSGGEPIVIDLDFDGDGRVAAFRFVSGFSGRGRQERLRELPDDWQ
jgi:hypothetical protein